MLTDVQQQALDQIQRYRRQEHQFINLYGPKDAGKTFLCWILQQNGMWEYYQALPERPRSPDVIYDHGNTRRQATRKLRNHATIHGLGTVLYVTRSPADELYPRVELSPEERHYKDVISRWKQLDLPTNDISGYHNNELENAYREY